MSEIVYGKMYMGKTNKILILNNTIFKKISEISYAQF